MPISQKSTSKKFRPPLRADWDLSQTSSSKPNFDSNFSIYPFHIKRPRKNFGRPYRRIGICLKVQTRNPILTQTLVLTHFTQFDLGNFFNGNDTFSWFNIHCIFVNFASHWLGHSQQKQVKDSREHQHHCCQIITWTNLHIMKYTQ